MEKLRIGNGGGGSLICQFSHTRVGLPAERLKCRLI